MARANRVDLGLPGFHTWMTDAACTEYPPDMWFPPKGGSNPKAVEICNGCPVRQKCLDFAISNHERTGIWGGVGIDKYRAGEQEAVA